MKSATFYARQFLSLIDDTMREAATGTGIVFPEWIEGAQFVYAVYLKHRDDLKTNNESRVKNMAKLRIYQLSDVIIIKGEHASIRIEPRFDDAFNTHYIGDVITGYAGSQRISLRFGFDGTNLPIRESMIAENEFRDQKSR